MAQSDPISLRHADYPRDGLQLISILLRGGTVFLQESFKAEAFVHGVKRHSITATFLVPTMIYVLLDEHSQARDELASLEMIIYGGSPISPKRLQQAIEVFGPKFMQVYSQSEAPTAQRSLPIRASIERSRQARLMRPAFARYPRRGSERTRSAGCPGFYRRGLLSRAFGDAGLLNCPQDTSETLRNGWLHTGDMAHQDAEGSFISWTGRRR